MKLAISGLGRMGINMARRLMQDGHQVVAYNRSTEKIDQLAVEGASPAYSPEEIIGQLEQPRVIWSMLPAGNVTEEFISTIASMMDKNDMIIDGGNTLFKDDIKRAARLKEQGIRYMDVGTSGGIWGLEVGYSLMAGGQRKDFDFMEPVFKSLAPEDGYIYCGDHGAGHYVKMIHNGIEYAMMQAYAEGFSLIKSSPYGDLDLSELSHSWNRGSVVRSWLLELAEDAFREDPDLDTLKPWVDDSGEGRWTVMQSIEQSEPAPVIALALMERFRSRQDNSFGNRVLAALRNQFGGHAVKKK